MKVQVTIKDVLASLEKFQKDHEKELAKATGIWEQQVYEAIAKLNADVKQKSTKADVGKLSLLFSRRPIDNRDKYNKHIGMLKLGQTSSSQETVFVDSEDYDKFFNDNWEWRNHSKFMNESYFNEADL